MELRLYFSKKIEEITYTRRVINSIEPLEKAILLFSFEIRDRQAQLERKFLEDMQRRYTYRRLLQIGMDKFFVELGINRRILKCEKERNFSVGLLSDVREKKYSIVERIELLLQFILEDIVQEKLRLRSSQERFWERDFNILQIFMNGQVVGNDNKVRTSRERKNSFGNYICQKISFGIGIIKRYMQNWTGFTSKDNLICFQ